VCGDIQSIAREGFDPFTLDGGQRLAIWLTELEEVGETALAVDLECYRGAPPESGAVEVWEAAVNRERAVRWLFSSWGARVGPFRELGAVATAARLMHVIWDGDANWPVAHARQLVAAAWRCIHRMVRSVNADREVVLPRSR
jgi:hypothetical protein